MGMMEQSSLLDSNDVTAAAASAVHTGAESLQLTASERICLAAVLEDSVDQLAILGRIMPTSLMGQAGAPKVVEDEITEIVESQKRLENQFEVLNMQLAELRAAGPKSRDKMSNAQNDLQDILDELKGSHVALAKSMRQSPLTPESMTKIQNDRAFMEEVLQQSLAELLNSGTFQGLGNSIMEERNKRNALQRMVKRDETGRREIRQMQDQIRSVKKEKEDEIQKRNEMIAHLKDQLQEMKAKTAMERKYVQKSSEVSVTQTKKKCDIGITQLNQQIKNVNEKINEEIRVNQDIESFLLQKQQDLSEKLNYWSKKYEDDYEAKKKELEILKLSKAQDFQKLQELTKKYKGYEAVVVDDRYEKEMAKRRAEQMAEEFKACNSIQAWWRGCMVRNQIGPYGKKKGKKGGKKGGKKSGGGKKKSGKKK